LWYGTNATGGSGSTTAPTPSTAIVGSNTFYVSQTGTCGEGPRAAIVVNVTSGPSAPVVTSPINYCQDATASALTATGTGLLWYTTATGGIGSATAPVPGTATVGTTTYFVSQTSGCESPRTSITVSVTAAPSAPAVTTPVTYCQNSTATALTASGNNLLWYGNNATGGTGSSNSPIPSTTTLGNTIYYVSQSNGSCESPRAAVTVSIVASTPTPTIITPVTYCVGSTATMLTATGTNLLWYGTNATGGTGSSTATTPSTTTAGSMTYYVSQTTNCGEGPRAAIVVNVVAIPSSPTATSPISYCQGATATAVAATGTNLIWYTTFTGGAGNNIAPVPNTTAVGSITYYVSQSTGTCESGRTAIIVNVNPTPGVPGITSPIIYCQGAISTALTAMGTNLLWYGTNATGGTGSSTAPTPSTATAGSTTYYVSQTIGACEGPRAAIVVTVTALLTAPMVVSPIAYCQGTAATALTATGTGLLWFTNAAGGVGVTMAPIPSTLVAGSVTYYVAQTNSCGEGARATIVVNTSATPLAVTNLNASDITETSALLTWTGAAGNFYTIEYKISSATTWTVAATGITSNSIALINLNRGTTYNFRVYANCNAQAGGNVSSIATFSTSSRNSTITNIKKGFGLKLTPNPIQSSGVLDYIVPGNGTVGITVIEANGKVVRNLFNANQNSGQYSLNISNQLNSLAKGIYIIKLTQNGNGIILKCIKN
jgi:hypothetical protein